METMSTTDKLAETAWLADRLDDPRIRIVEIGDLKNPEAYAGGHIPGAVHWPWQQSLWDLPARQFITPDAFAKLMKKSGIRHDTTIVLYSGLTQYATYAFWVCTMRGHLKIKVLNGNRELWRKQGRRLTQAAPSITATDYPLRPVAESCRIGRDGVLAGLENPDRVLLDLRTPEEYAGKRVSPVWFSVDHGATVKGHIPGARHLYYLDLLYDDETFKPPGELRALFEKCGATPDREIVLYCRLSHRATLGWFILRQLLKYPRVKVYDGSWTEWGSLVGVPVVNESMTRK